MNAYDVRSEGDYDFTALEKYLNIESVQAALGVNRTFAIANAFVKKHLKDDIVKSALYLIGDILDLAYEKKLIVVFYTGIFDLDCNIVGHLKWLNRVEWKGKASLKDAPQTKWIEENNTAGYARVVRGFTDLEIQGSGHMVPMDVPERAQRMLKRVLQHEPF